MKNESLRFSAYRDAVDKLHADLLETHQATFQPLREKLRGKDVAVLATGPSLQLFTPWEPLVLAGVNHAIFYTAKPLEYVFVQDHVPAILAAYQYSETPCNLIYARHVTYPQFRIDEEEVGGSHAASYYSYSVQSPYRGQFTANVLDQGLYDFTSIIFSALQILLFCTPRNIYLVGCDCSDTHNFINKCRGGLHSTLFAPWLALQRFAAEHYPSVRIHSINPIGLKGIFEDIYQNEPATQALTCLAQNNTDAALHYARLGLNQEPENHGVRKLLIDLLRRHEAYSEADAITREAMEHLPVPGEWYRQLSLTAEARGDNGTALRLARTAVDADPQAFALRAHLAMLLRKSGNEQAAQQTLDAATSPAFLPYWGMILNDNASVCEENGNIEKFIDWQQEALRILPKDFRTRYWLLEFLRRTGRFHKAVKTVQEGLRLNPKWAEGYHQLARIAESRGLLDEAIAHCRKAMDLEPLAVMYRALLAQLLRQKGHFLESLSTLQEALTVTPDWADGHYESSLTYAAQGNMNNALAHARQAVALLPAQLSYCRPYRTHLAALLNKMGLRCEAESSVMEALTSTPGWGEGYRLRSLNYETYGEGNAVF